jgi:exonuclease III
MPYKDKQKQKEFMRKYRTPYMARYRKFKTDKQKNLEEAIRKGDLNVARQIMGRKPNITLFSQTWQDMFGQKKRKR